MFLKIVQSEFYNLDNIITSTIFKFTAISQASSLTSTANQRTPINSPVSTVVVPSATVDLEMSIRQLDRELYKIKRQLFRTMKQREVPLEEILDWIKFPPLSLRTHFAELTRVLFNPLPTVSDLDELFVVLPQYWNSLQPSVLEHFVDMLEDDDLQERMQRYMKNLSHFCKQTPLVAFLDKWVGEIPSKYQEITIELGEKWREKTVEDLMQLQVRISCLKSFGGGHMPFLKETKSSSVFVILTLPQHLFPLDFRQKALHDFLRSEDALKVIIDGQCVLDLKKMVSFLFTGHSVA